MVAFVVGLAVTLLASQSVEYDPQVAQIINSVSQDSLVSTVASLSGEKSVTIDGMKDSIPCRYSHSPGSYKAAQWIAGELEARGVSAEFEPFLPQNFLDVGIMPSGKGWAVSSNYIAKPILYTDDSGVSWHEKARDDFYQSKPCVTKLAVISDDTAWYTSGEVIMCTVDGENWTTMRSKTPRIFDVSSVNSDIGWATGDWGAVISTTDGWETFKETYPIRESGILHHVCFISPKTGWISSANRLWVTWDGAENWQELNNPADSITELVFVDSMRGYLTGVNGAGTGIVSKSIDGGVTWQIVKETGDLIPNDICTLDSDVIWIAGSDGMVFYSEDGGASWQERSLESGDMLNAISARGGDKAVVTGMTKILYTIDGKTWNACDTTGLETMFNVIGTLEGSDTGQIIISAHYDAIVNDADMMSVYTPGADDNASGVSTVLEAARILSGRDWHNTLKFVLFGYEEWGGYGSASFSANNKYKDVLAFLNIDMIAYDSMVDREVCVSNYTQENPLSFETGNVFCEVLDVYDLGLNPVRKDDLAGSDCDLLWGAGFAGIDISEDEAWGTDFNPYWHTVGDQIDILDQDYFTEVSRACVGWMAVMANMDSIVGIEERPMEPLPEVVAIKLSSNIVRSETYLDIASPLPVIPCIYDASGRKVKTLSVHQKVAESPSGDPRTIVQRFSLSVLDLPAGVYWVGVKGITRQVSERFVVIR